MTSNPLIESSIDRTAKLLLNTHGVQVIFQGDEAKTDGKYIYLPSLPENASPEAAQALQGYLDHEAAHVLYTDFSRVNKKFKGLSNAEKQCVNMLEDVRIETIMERTFPGSRVNLKQSSDLVSSQLISQWEDLSKFAQASCAYIYKARYGEDAPVYQAASPEIKEYVGKCENVIKKMPKSTGEVIELFPKVFKILKPLLDESDEDSEDTYSQARKAVLVQAIDESAVTTTDYYRIFSTKNDTLIPPASTHNTSLATSLRDPSITGATRVLQAKLQGAFTTQVRRRWISTDVPGKLNPKRLYRAVTGATNLYKSRTTNIGLDTAVCLAIDHSGSMFGPRIDLAAKAALALGDVLHRLKVPFCVYGYSTKRGYTTPSDEDKHKYSRWNNLWLKMYGDFRTPWTQVAPELAHAHSSTKLNTLDGESILFGARKLLARQEPRKVLLLFTDGYTNPGADGHRGDCEGHQQRIIKAVEAAGIEIIAFGIQSDYVANWYQNYVVIEDLNDLTKEPLRKLKEFLVGGANGTHAKQRA